MSRVFVSSTIAVMCLALSSPAFGGAGTTTDSSDNHRPPELHNQPTYMRSDYEEAKHLMRGKHYAEAIPHLQIALANKPNDTDILGMLALAKRMTGDYDSALYYYQRAATIDPNSKTLHEGAGETDLAKNDVASAQKELATLTTLCPSSCDERDALTKAIGDYKPATANTATTPPAIPPSGG